MKSLTMNVFLSLFLQKANLSLINSQDSQRQPSKLVALHKNFAGRKSSLCYIFKYFCMVLILRKENVISWVPENYPSTMKNIHDKNARLLSFNSAGGSTPCSGSLTLPYSVGWGREKKKKQNPWLEIELFTNTEKKKRIIDMAIYICKTSDTQAIVPHNLTNAQPAP